MTSITEPIGFYVNCDDALCAEHFVEPAERVVTGEITADDPLAIFPDTESDSPTHCVQCGALIPHALTPDGVGYVSDAIAEWRDWGVGNADVLRQWVEAYEDVIEF